MGEQRGFDHGGSDSGHAAMIGGATAEKAWRAVGLLLNDGGARRDGRSAFRVGGAKDGDDGKTDGSSYVHGAGIVAEEKMALREKAGQSGDSGFAREVDGRALEFGGDGAGDGYFGWRAEEDDVGVVLGEERVDGFGETIGRPTFGGAVGSAGADSDAESVGAHARFEKSLQGAMSGGVGDMEGDVGIVVEPLEPAGAAKELEIVELFVWRNFAGRGDLDGLREEKRAGIARVADALRDLSAPGEPGGIEGILEKKRDIEFAGAEFGGEGFAAVPAAVSAVGIVGDELVGDLLVSVDFGNIGAGNDADVGFGMTLANGAERGQGHDGVADPVGGADQDFHAVALLASMAV